MQGLKFSKSARKTGNKWKFLNKYNGKWQKKLFFHIHVCLTLFFFFK